jgi:hypothetical protein
MRKTLNYLIMTSTAKGSGRKGKEKVCAVLHSLWMIHYIIRAVNHLHILPHTHPSHT